MSNQSVSSNNLGLNFSLAKLDVLRKAIGLLGLAVLVAAAVGYFSLARGFVNPTLSLVAIIAVFIMGFIVPRQGDTPLGVALVLIAGGLLGYAVVPSVAVFISIGKAAVVIQALISTFVLFTALYLYATITKKDFTNIGGFVSIAFIVLIVLMLLNLFIFHSPMLSVIISYGVVVIVSAGILYKLSIVVNGGEVSAVNLAFSLLIDVYNLFVSLLNIFGNRE